MLKPDHELTNFKQTIDPCNVLTGHGFTLDKTKSTTLGRVMRRDDEKFLVMKGHGDNWIITDTRAGKSGTVIDLIQWLDGCNLGQVRVKLRHYAGLPINDSFPSCPKQDRLPATPVHLGSLKPATCNTANLQARGIGDLVQCPQFIGKVFEDRRGNACFPHYDNAGLSGWEIKNDRFTGFMTGGKKGLWFSNQPESLKRLVLCESAIDAISYHAIHAGDDARYLSIGGGIGHNQIILITRAIERTPNDCLIVLAVDNDNAGNGYIEQITALINGCRQVHTDRPTGAGVKDWNESLIAITPMTDKEAAVIRSWLDYIDETDPEIIAEVMDKCKRSAEARATFTRLGGMEKKS
jgi:hypothetical protein